MNLKSTIYTTIAFAAIVIFGVLLGQRYFANQSDANLVIRYEDPVDVDFDAIKERGVIRLITRYSSVSYFLHHGLERGFEFEFFSEFAKAHDLRVEVVIPSQNEDPIDLLNRGAGDVIAQNYTITPQRARYIEFSEPYNLVNQVVVLPTNMEGLVPVIDSLAGLTLTVRRGSSYFNVLRDLRARGLEITIQTVPENWDTEALIMAVANGEIEATVADDNLFAASTMYINGVIAGPSLSNRDLVSWGLRRNAPHLKNEVDEFLASHFRLQEVTGEPRRSALLNILRQRYFEDERMVQRFRTPVPVTEYSGLLSPYDGLIQPIAHELGVDWKLIVAIMAQESRFNPNAISWAGAVGLMQVIPRFTLLTEEELLDEETNVREGIRILKEHLDHYAYLDTLNQVSLALATYNAGLGHVADARRIAIDRNRDPNVWENVEHGLMMLMNPQHYMNARHGFARGIETSNYVRDVMNRYRMYQTIVSLAAEQDNRQNRRLTLGFNDIRIRSF
jgi:membrane-bound lytic murein transglycosylase F